MLGFLATVGSLLESSIVSWTSGALFSFPTSSCSVRVFQLAKLDRQIGERFGDQHVQESHRNFPPGTSSSSSSPWPSAGEFHHNNNRDHQSYFHDQNLNYPNHNQNFHHQHPNPQPNHFNGGFGYGYSAPPPPRKRGWQHFNRGVSPDHIKLYVSSVPRTATEQDIRPLFEHHGNIVEVVILRDKKTGVQQGSCFVKYATVVEANRAIAALNNQYTFPGECLPLTVKYAEREKERLGLLDKAFVPNLNKEASVQIDKVFVANLNKEASSKEIEEIFSPYGFIEDIYIVRDDMRQSRGCGFVKFSHKDMALAAINALNGIYTMGGVDKPLAVRFAEPKKPRTGELRTNNMFNNTTFFPHSQESVVSRPTPHIGDSMVGHNRPIAPHLPQPFSTLQPPAVSGVANQEHPQFSHMPFQQRQNLETSSQSFQGVVVESQKPLHLVQPSMQIVEQQQQSQASRLPPSQSGNNSEVASDSTALAAVPVNPHISELLECDWSEHTCPDGDKYYYNCVTCESKWDKPKEFALFEQQLQKQRQQQNPYNQIQSSSPVISTPQVAQTQEIQHTNVFHQKLQLQKPSLSAPEMDHVEVQ